MVEEIEKRNIYNRDFVTTLAHELRTPLTAIKGATEILEESENLPLEKREKFQANIRIETERVIRMVNELGELTRLDAETLRTERETVDYSVFIRQVLEKLEPAFDQPHARLVPEIPEEIIDVNILPTRIEQVFANLLENAFRYTPSEGKVTLRVQTSPDGEVRTDVEDTGCGIDPVNLSKVFDRFFTTEPTGQPRDHGSGLGLSIVKSIIKNHGGTIRAKNIPDGGARFTFTLT
jgi:signal transduction histidine kinase